MTESASSSADDPSETARSSEAEGLASSASAVDREAAAREVYDALSGLNPGADGQDEWRDWLTDGTAAVVQALADHGLLAALPGPPDDAPTTDRYSPLRALYDGAWADGVKRAWAATDRINAAEAALFPASSAAQSPAPGQDGYCTCDQVDAAEMRTCGIRRHREAAPGQVTAAEGPTACPGLHVRVIDSTDPLCIDEDRTGQPCANRAPAPAAVAAPEDRDATPERDALRRVAAALREARCAGTCDVVREIRAALAGAGVPGQDET